MARAQSVETLLGDPATPQPLRGRLELARAIRDYSVRELKLPDNASYRSYAELERPYAVWNVVAAPEFSLEPVQSCFPVAGCVAYRGFFARGDAERYAARLRADGFEVYIYGVPAYSTLGAFDDPLLSTFIRWPAAELARLVFHELAHQVAYRRDDTSFNESFAVVVEREGVRRWLAARETPSEMAEYEKARAQEAEFTALLDATRTQLEAVYRSRLAPEGMREKKRGLLERLAADPVYLRHAARLDGPPSNSLLASLASYTQLVPAFERLLAEESGNLERFYARVRQLARVGGRPS